VPRRFDKHLTQVKRRRSQALELEEGEESSSCSYEDDAFSDYQARSASGERIRNLSSSPKKSAKEI